MALIDWFLPRAPRDALRFVRQLTPEDPRFADALTQATGALEPENPLGVRSMALDVLGELSRHRPMGAPGPETEHAREALRQAARSDPSWRIRAKARSILKRLAGY